MKKTVILGVSHKMYFGWQQTLDWCSEVASALPPGSESTGLELFTLPMTPALSIAIKTFAGTPMGVGAQNMSEEPPGAWTGETSASFLEEMGCRYIELGHAERRRHFGETVETIVRKLKLALIHHLTPVICIGELEQVSAQRAAHIAIAQSQELLNTLGKPLESPIILAWEPQWAIGASAPASDGYIREVCSTLRRHLQQQYDMQVRVIYGGSAGPGLLSRLWPDVDGLFLGRFAHQPSAFSAILDEALAITASGMPSSCHPANSLKHS
ncbi:triose-phosphate isomerase family protein [Erwinia piriflorinigrans]|uniref:triose-phosphate isomerase family protein n=1 Tax=Erwinia piriflorinigrans TaxID=665097 RepID=UPI000A8A9893|nr:triose-phosphate isomerase family protein [Erwinia piriflorinigrans]